MKIYVIGDSISAQYGPHLRRFVRGLTGCPQAGEDRTLVEVDTPEGAKGGDSSRVLAFLEASAQAGGLDADLLLLNCGLHDIRTDPATGAKQVPIEQYRENLQAIVRTVADLKPRLVWIRTTSCDETVHNREGMKFHRFSADCTAYNQAADETMAEAGVPAIDLHAFTLTLGPDLYCDHVHFHEHIREKQGAFLAGWLAAFAGSEAGMALR